MTASDPVDPSADLLRFAGKRRFAMVLADPPWRFINRTGKMAPEHHRLSRYGTLSIEEIAAFPVNKILAETAHLYLWVPNALLPEGLVVMKSWVLIINQILFGINCAKTVVRMGAVLDFISIMLRNCYCLACAVRTPVRGMLAGRR